jgi:hypothetical protein
MRLLFSIFAICLLLSALHAYRLNASREELLAYYQNHLEEKMPRSAKMLIGSERINVYVGGEVFGIETRLGELYYFEEYALEKPGIVINVTDDAAQKITTGKAGILQSIDDGGIKIESKNFLSALRVETIKRIYAISGVDDQLTGRKKGMFPSPPAAPGYSSTYTQTAHIWN